jgi:hypothetical protein
MSDVPDNIQFGRRQQDSGIIVKLELLHEDVGDMKAVLKDLTIAINRLALVEERQAQTAASLERAFSALEKVEGRVSVLELSNVNTSRTSHWLDKAIVAIIAAIITLGVSNLKGH